MDVFSLRLECVSLLRRLTASQQSIAKVVDYAIRHAANASDDIWECIVNECSKATLNARLNILFLVDALLLQIVDPVGFSASSSTAGGAPSSSTATATLAQVAVAYLSLAARDIGKFILQGVVPRDNWDAVRLNASSTEKVLLSWKRLNIFDHAVLDDLVTELRDRKRDLGNLPSSARIDFSKKDILKRIDEDRERHKRLRERAWILPARSFVDALPALRSINTASVGHASDGPDATSDVEFNYIWENLSTLNEDDLRQIQEDDSHWWGSSRISTKEKEDAVKLEAQNMKSSAAAASQEESQSGTPIQSSSDSITHRSKWRQTFGRPSQSPSIAQSHQQDRMRPPAERKKEWNSPSHRSDRPSPPPDRPPKRSRAPFWS